jgi:hypothetical protein
MWTPLEPNLGRGDDGIPAADPGAGAPAPADGFGIGGEEPDRPEGSDRPGGVGAPGTGATETGMQQSAEDGDPPFRTPDPGEVGRG